MAALDPLDLSIIGALQIDGRASWRRIAAAIGESDRTVARRGTQLLQDRSVVVGAVAALGQPMLVRARCAPGMARVAASVLARREDCNAVYLLTGRNEFVAEFFIPQAQLAAFVLDELSGLPGVSSIETIPITRYLRAVHEWQPGLLSAAQIRAMDATAALTPSVATLAGTELGRQERAIAAALVGDGRLTYEELARLVGTSEATARRRVEAMRADGSLFIRASVDPALLGLPVEAVLSISTRPAELDKVGEALIGSPHVRYAAATGGAHQLMAHVALPDMTALHSFITGSPWSALANSVEHSLIVAAPKRTGVRA